MILVDKGIFTLTTKQGSFINSLILLGKLPFRFAKWQLFYFTLPASLAQILPLLLYRIAGLAKPAPP
jgi:hypothetical protein